MNSLFYTNSWLLMLNHVNTGLKGTISWILNHYQPLVPSISCSLSITADIGCETADRMCSR